MSVHSSVLPQTATLKERADWVRKETIRLHGIAPQTRVASSLSCVEIVTALYYGGVMAFDPCDLYWDERDRFVVSKGHGSISMFPILADLGFFDKAELERICQAGSLLGSIPDPTVPGYETVNGSLGHGLGVACGNALALKSKGRAQTVFVLSGDGEFYEGSVWEAVMLAPRCKLDNLVVIVDNNKGCMLDFSRNIIDLEPLEEKLTLFGWDTMRVDGHDADVVRDAIVELKTWRNGKPKLLMADTVKGKGILQLEIAALSHITILKKEEVDLVLAEWDDE